MYIAAHFTTMTKITLAALLLFACLFANAQGLEDTFDDGVSTDKNLIGINLGGLYSGTLDLRYTRLFDRNNIAESEGLELGIGFGVGEYSDPFAFGEWEDVNGEAFDPTENLSGHTRFALGWYTLPGSFFGSSNIGYGGGFNFAYTRLSYDPIEESDEVLGDYSFEMQGWTLASSFHLNIHGYLTDHLRFTVAGGPAYLMARWTVDSDFASDLDPDGRFAITGQAQLAYSF